ncbi:MAG: zinc ribbon domain-containing protein, partial [Candidatus Xenobia bacterium]
PTETAAFVEGRIKIPYKWPAGRVGTAYLEATKARRFVATRCDACHAVYCPPKAHCIRCHVPMQSQLDVGPAGTVVVASRGLGLMLLDGSDTALLHKVPEVASGTRVQPGWSDEGLTGFTPTEPGRRRVRYGIAFHPAGTAPRIPPGVALLGVASIPPGADRRAASFSELVHEVVQGLYAQLGVDDTFIDTIVTASSDFLDGRTISDMALMDVVGAPGRSASKVSMDGVFGLLYGAARVGSGMFGTCLMTAHSKLSEGSPRAISQAAFDPVLVRPLDLTDHDVLRLQARRWRDLQEQPWQDDEPLAPDSDGAVALLLAEESIARKLGKPYLLLAGAGYAAHVPDFAARDLADAAPVTHAMRQACETAGVRPSDVQVAETMALSRSQLEMYRDALGIEAPAASLSHNPGFATGFYGLAEVWRRMQESHATLGLVHAAAGYVGQNHAVWILRKP